MLNAFYRFLDKIFFPQSVAIIMYHGFTDTEGSLFNYHGKHLHIDKFEAQLKHLGQYYNVISLKDLLRSHQNQTPLPQGSVILTFDDGYESNYTLAFEALKKFKMPASIFLTTDFIERHNFIWANRVEYALLSTEETSLSLPIKGVDLKFELHDNEAKMNAVSTLKPLLKPLEEDVRSSVINELEDRLNSKLTFDGDIPAVHKPLTWTHIKKMSNCGLISFGGHTCSHAILTSLNDNVIEREITQSKTIIEQKMNTSCELFCYPYGDKGTFDERTAWLLEKCGYALGLTTIQGHSDNKENLFELKRLGTSNAVDLDHFRNNLLLSRKTLRRKGVKF